MLVVASLFDYSWNKEAPLILQTVLQFQSKSIILKKKLKNQLKFALLYQKINKLIEIIAMKLKFINHSLKNDKYKM